MCLPLVVGPMQVILYTQEDVVERVLHITGGKGVKVVFDGGTLHSPTSCVPKEEARV